MAETTNVSFPALPVGTVVSQEDLTPNAAFTLAQTYTVTGYTVTPNGLTYLLNPEGMAYDETYSIALDSSCMAGHPTGTPE